MIVATAGHIDHGKTSLVKALTGMNTDRLPEERVRGISIDLGFAHVDLDEFHRVSFIDVPGHERFLRNMLAGVSGIDTAILVVAADDGVMPQTCEHLQILDLLDVRSGAIVVTKTDLVSAERLDEVVKEIQAIAARTLLEGAEIFPVSTVTGRGLPIITDWLLAQALLSRAHPLAHGHQFRMPVDRAFSIAGSGTIVTGTIHAGTVVDGDRCLVSPRGHRVRVRSVQVQGSPAAQVSAGQRCALNLAGVSVEDVGRGDWIVHEAAHEPTQRLDARLRVLLSESEPISHWTPVHLHLGTADVSARIILPADVSIAPGTSGFAQFVIDRPISALHGDRFVVRDQSARRTLGGGVVLDPFARKRKRGANLRAAALQVYERSSPAAVLTGLLDLSENGIDLTTFARAMNLSAEAAVQTQLAAGAMVLGRTRPIGISRAAGGAITVRILEELRKFHSQHPRVRGMDVLAVHEAIAPRLATEAFRDLVRELANRQLVVLSNDIARLREHESTSNKEDEDIWARVRNALLQAGTHAPLISDLARELGLKEQPLRDFLHRKSRTGEIWKITPERFCLRSTLARLATTSVELAQSKPDGFFSASEFRDIIGTGRGLAIHYLEFFDQLGITQRFGDRRRAGKDYKPILGAAEPFITQRRVP